MFTYLSFLLFSLFQMYLPRLASSSQFNCCRARNCEKKLSMKFGTQVQVSCVYQPRRIIMRPLINEGPAVLAKHLQMSFVELSVNSKLLNIMLVFLLNKTTLRFEITHLWSLRKPLFFDTQNPEILGFSIAHAYKNNKRPARTVKFIEYIKIFKNCIA